jgi:hypothetical protein
VTCEGDRVLRSQDDLDAFIAEGCTSLEGGLALEDATFVAQLELSSLVAVGGDLRVQGNADLVSIALPALEAIGGSLLAPDDDSDDDGVENPELSSVSLPALATLGGELHLELGGDEPSLAFPALEQIGGAIKISISGAASVSFPSLRDVSGESVAVRGFGLDEIALDALEAASHLQFLDGVVSLAALESVGSFSIESGEISAPSLVELGSLYNDNGTLLYRLEAPALERVEGDLVARVYTESIALPSLRAVGGELQLSPYTGDGEGHKLSSLLETISLPALETVGDLYLGGEWAPEGQLDLSSLTTVTGEAALSGVRTLSLDALASTGQSLTLSRLQVTGLELSALESVGDALKVTDNEALVSLHTPALSRVDGNLSVTDNPALPTCDARALEAQLLAADGIGGEVYISGNLPDGC